MSEEWMRSFILMNATAADFYLLVRNIKIKDYQKFFDALEKRGGEWNVRNIHWESRRATYKGRELLGAIYSIIGNMQTTDRPAYWPTIDINYQI